MKSNNYIAIFQDREVSQEDWFKYQNESPENLFKRKDGKFYMAGTKCKGRFEFKERALHKNHSFNVISKALYAFFVHGIPVETSIKSNTDIFDYCGQTKATGAWNFIFSRVINSIHAEDEVQKTLRYYISSKGGKLIKVNKADGRQIQVEAGIWLQTVFNLYIEKPFTEYNINYQFYISNANKEIKALKPELFTNQLTLNF